MHFWSFNNHENDQSWNSIGFCVVCFLQAIKMMHHASIDATLRQSFEAPFLYLMKLLKCFRKAISVKCGDIFIVHQHQTTLMCSALKEALES